MISQQKHASLDAIELVIVLDSFPPKAGFAGTSSYFSRAPKFKCVHIGGRRRCPARISRSVGISSGKKCFVSGLHLLDEGGLKRGGVEDRPELRGKSISLEKKCSRMASGSTNHYLDVILMTNHSRSGAKRDGTIARIRGTDLILSYIGGAAMRDPVPCKSPAGTSPEIVRAKNL